MRLNIFSKGNATNIFSKENATKHISIFFRRCASNQCDAARAADNDEKKAKNLDHLPGFQKKKNSYKIWKSERDPAGKIKFVRPGK